MAGLSKNIGKYPFTFTTADLDAGVLTVTHNLGTNYPKPSLRLPDNTYLEGYTIMTFIDINSVSFDFGGAITAGTWVGFIGE